MTQKASLEFPGSSAGRPRDHAELERLLSLSSASQAARKAQGPTRVYSVDPLSDPRWERFIRVHPRATVFQPRRIYVHSGHCQHWIRMSSILPTNMPALSA